MGDPLFDPRFPNRPQTPDFWRLSETALMLDGKTVEGQQHTFDTTSEFVDVVSLDYMCEVRTAIMLQELGMGGLPDSIKVLFQAAMMGGVVHGIAFEKAGGHRV